MDYIRTLDSLRKEDVAIAGGKGASLGEMINAGISVPPGFVVLSSAFNKNEKVIEEEIVKAFDMLGAQKVAVRSSSTAEDGKQDAWAGQLDTFLNVERREVFQKVKACWASVASQRAAAYKAEKKISETSISVAVIVQKMVDAEKAGVAFSMHPVTQNKNEIVIEAVEGLGESLVSGEATPDAYVVLKDSDGISSKQCKGEQLLSDDKILKLTSLVKRIENHYGFPCDIEWAYKDGAFFILQSRPITTLKNPLARKDIWIKEGFFNGLLVEESLVLLQRNNIYLKELGTTYYNTITVKDVGDFLIESEVEKMREAKKKNIKPRLDFINRVNVLESKIHQVVADESKNTIENYTRIFNLMSEHLAYYGLAKEEAELAFDDPQTPQQEKEYIETWRNDKERWNSHDKLWERIASQTATTEEIIHVMLINEVLKLLKKDSLDIDAIKKRINSIWSLVEKDGVASLYFKDMSPVMKLDAQGDGVITGQPGYSTDEIITGIVGDDILVVKKTHPDMVKEIRAARAVVTDEGGILSHAAITCREFRVPCIIGTKVGTEMLKRGDKIQIDSVQGIIKKVV
jgi:phosphoenolpyruvate synthase/pyruvate phosphate dikinase